MPEVNFFQSWAFWFLAGIVIGFAAGFALTIIIAAGSRRSRAEAELIYPKIEIATQGKPEDD